MEKTGKTTGVATIVDVARRAGVSIKTVSRVVNKEANVQEKTRLRVSAAIAELNYQPNTAARGLSGKRSYSLGLLYENARESGYFKDVLNGALRTSDAEGYGLLLRPFSLPSDSLRADVRQFVLQTRVDGILLTAPLSDHADVTGVLDELHIPYVQMTPKNIRPGMLNILCNDAEASCAVTEYVMSLGHQRIGFIKGHPEHRSAVERFAGYRLALKKAQVKYEPGLVKPGYFDFESGKKAARALLRMGSPPTAIIASNDDMAAGVVYEAYELGLTIPGQLSVVGFDDTPTASHIWPPLTTVRQPIDAMAAQAVLLLTKKIRGEKNPEETSPFQCELVLRASTAAPIAGQAPDPV
jgi:LacI family transcriptional regulator